ncbi:MAG: glycerophosphodiester phosphodiesterase family protein [Solirubrobacterales bacterium]|nr:glycerophosphodiester phosphodiesterase family protein [Solirubrobacterales bacterium]
MTTKSHANKSRFIALACCTAFAALAFTGTASAAPYKWLRSTPLVMAHQGGEDEFPSNTMYAFKKAIKAGANSLELDIGVTSDNKVVIRHDTTVNSTTNGSGNVSGMTLAQIRTLDAAYWFAQNKGHHYDHGYLASDYTFRGVATGAVPPPTGYKAADFRVATLSEVMAAFPNTPINIEIKGRTPAEDTSEYITNATVLGNLLKTSTRTDLVVVSFKQEAVDKFSTIATKIPTAPGIAGDLKFFWQNSKYGKSMSKQTVAFQVPTIYRIGSQKLLVGNCGFIGMAHKAGYAWHSWFSGDPGDTDARDTWRWLLDRRVDGIMTARPAALIKFMSTYKKSAANNVCHF